MGNIASRLIDVDVLTDLKNKASQVEWFKDERQDYFAIMSRRGFTKRLVGMAEREGIILKSIS